MAEELSISLKIAGAEIKVKTKPEEEAILRTAARILNDKFKEFQQTYHIDDRGYIMTMLAFGSMVEKMKGDNQLSENNILFDDKLKELHKIIDNIQ